MPNRGIQIRDEHSSFFGWQVRNELLVCLLAVCQLVVVISSLLQHVYSLFVFNKIFNCSFNTTDTNKPVLNNNNNNNNQSRFGEVHPPVLTVDIIVFDFGLFHRMLSLPYCLANKIDGAMCSGYGRFIWCLCHAAAILVVMSFGRWRDKSGRNLADEDGWQGSPFRLCPLLAVQNAYCFGLMLLTLAVADKLLVSLMRPKDAELTGLILIFLVGTSLNHFLCYLLWHAFWHLEAVYRRRHGRPFQTWL